MRLKVATLSYGFIWLSLLKCCHPTQSKVCDNAKTKLETDLPQSNELACPESGPRSSSRLPDISTKYPVQPAEHICMDMPITYNHTIPSSGAHRPKAAESGEYLYCPPQRWLNNLKDGAIVLLYHPCVSEAARRSLAAVANCCLPHYILTAHPQLSLQRPFALVSWGRTLEMSHITTAGVCEWLLTASICNHTKASQRPQYSLYLAKAASVDRVLCTAVKLTGSKTKFLKSLRECCVEALSAYEHPAERSRRTRAANQLAKDKAEQSEGPLQNISESQTLKTTHSQPATVTDDGEAPSAGVPVVAASVGDGGQANETGATATEGERPSQSGAGHGAKRLSVSTNLQPQTAGKSQGGPTGNILKHRVKTDVEEPSARDGQDVAPTAGQKPPPPGQRMPTQRTDEALWAAAALGFLLVLLTISVLHTRLYRNWRSPDSLYWHEARQDYESVADIIRRRLRMVGRRKRKPSQSRRQELPLLPDSSTDNESD